VLCGFLGNNLTVPYVIERRFTVPYFRNFLVNILRLYLEDMPHATRRSKWLKHEGVSPNFGRDSKKVWNKNFEEKSIGRNVSVA
jgi:hypothetical protein